jgi:tetratricopeptide (TPR) repeat protein
MKPEFLLLAAALIGGGCAGDLKLVRTPPGTSVEVALAKKAELVKLPGPPPAPPGQTVRYEAVEPALPQLDRSVMAEESLSLGRFCMEAGADAEAIVAFEKAVEIDPESVEAWQGLATVYERIGNADKAQAAAQKSAKLARH